MNKDVFPSERRGCFSQPRLFSRDLSFEHMKLLVRSSNRFTCHPASFYRRRKSSIGWKNLGFVGMDGDLVARRLVEGWGVVLG